MANVQGTDGSGRVDLEAHGAGVRPHRRPRADAKRSCDRLLTAAASVLLREGRNVPLATIAAEAEVGVGTLYRSYADRETLLHALEYRAWGLLNCILNGIETEACAGLEAVEAILARTLAVGDQLVLPLHGAPPLVNAQAVDARRSINRRLESFIQRGRDGGSLRAPVNATVIIVFSALITQPLPHGPHWHRLAERQLAIFVNGLSGSDPIDIPGHPVRREDIEEAFVLRATAPRVSFRS